MVNIVAPNRPPTLNSPVVVGIAVEHAALEDVPAAALPIAIQSDYHLNNTEAARSQFRSAERI